MQMGPQGKIHEALQKWAAEYGSVFKYFLGRRPCIVITGEAPGAARCGLLPRPGASARLCRPRAPPLLVPDPLLAADPDLVRQICVKRFIDYHDRSLVSPPRSTCGGLAVSLAPHAAARRADRPVRRQVATLAAGWQAG